MRCIYCKLAAKKVYLQLIVTIAVIVFTTDVFMSDALLLRGGV